MGSISIQFHALRDEINVMVREMNACGGVNLTFMGGSPFHVWPWRGDDHEIVDPNVSHVAFTLYPVTHSYSSRYDFLMSNPNALILNIGALTSEGLHESWLSCKTDDDESLKKWKSLASIIKKKTLAGATAFDLKSGESCVVKNHRYTVGAQDLSKSQVEILPIAGSARYRLGS
jgi:hypothetical protein